MMRTKLFESATLKLTIIYTSMIVCISLIFSFWLYNVSISEVRSSVLQIEIPMGRRYRFEDDPEFLKDLRRSQEQAVQDSRTSLFYNLFILNLFIMFGGAAISYFLARRTLRPIELAHDRQLRFTADASHELRTPITAMRLENEIALTDPALSLKQAKKQLSSTIEELDNLTSLTENLLNLARLDTAKSTKTQQSVKAVLLEAIRVVKPHADAKKQIVILSRAANFKAPVHAESLKNAVIILLDNAVKYSPEKSKITVKTTLHSKYFQISVTDQGVGIEKDALPHIFERFYRVDNSRSKNLVSGHGIGLSLAESYIEAQKGIITVKSTPTKGSTFTIQLPLK